MSKSSSSHGQKGTPAGGPAGLRAPLISAASALLVALTLTAPAQTKPDGRELKVGRIPQKQAQTADALRLTARPGAVSLCPGKFSRVQLSLSGPVPTARSVEYHWQAEGGSIKGAGASAVWDLSGARPGTYTAAVTLTLNSLVAAPRTVKREARVAVSECAEEAPPSCPTVSVDCPEAVAEGEPVTFTASVKGGGRPPGKVTFRWSVSDGAISEQDRRRMRVRTQGLGGRPVNGRYDVGGYGLVCAGDCRTFVQPRPSPTPSVKDDQRPAEDPTPKPTASVSPSPVQSPTPFVVANPSPTPEAVGITLTDPNRPPTPSPTTSPTPSSSPSPTPPADPAPSATAPPTETAPDANQPGAVATPGPSATVEGFFGRNLWLLLAALAAVASVVWNRWRSLGRDLGPWLKGRRELPPEGVGRGEPEPTKEAVAGEKSEADAPGGGLVHGGTDELQCSVYAPFRAAPGDAFLVQAFAHLAADAALLEGLAKEAQQDAERRGAKGLGPVARGQELTFHLQMPGLEIDEPSQTVVWKGEIETAQFGVTVPEDFKPRSVGGKVTVSSGSVPLGHIRFTLNVDAGPRPAPEEAEPQPYREFVRYRQAFISYASEDRAEVLRCVQMLSLVKVKYFQDVLSLEPGQRWEEGLYQNMRLCDVLFLFWSAAASRSQWVEKEVRYALDLKGGDDERPPEIIPVILQGPPEVPPPGYLAEYHFNDPFAFFIKAEIATSKSREP